MDFHCYRKRPVVVEAAQLTEPMQVETLEGTMRGNVGDWLIIGVEDERYFCKDSVFRRTYEAVAREAGATQRPPKADIGGGEDVLPASYPAPPTHEPH